ncbi:glycerophosphodiester phosphodiesterase [Phycicoccus avicenniae]|uniref:glycerophosphodiester phosphodiesterase n=1 Tax=Phycicoccus avicenniae TaxID=2828860 RepID=UPI003D29C15C
MSARGGRRPAAVVAHRGSAAGAPENTLAAVRLALEHGADVVETDVRRTRDGVLVVLHDESLARTTDVREVFPERGPWCVRDLTLEEVRRLDAGSWFGPAFAGERVPTLREWMDAVGDAGMLVEAKQPHLYPGIEHQLAAELRAVPGLHEASAAGRLAVQSFDRDWLHRFHEVAPDVPVALVHPGVPDDELLTADSTWLAALNPALGNITRELVDRMHGLGLATNVWTVNDPRDIQRALDWSVDGVITDHPELARPLVGARR